MASILVLHGPNLNLLGTREPEIYGADTLEDVHKSLLAIAQPGGHHLLSFQSNAEYEIIERIHEARTEGIDFIIINPAAFTHTSVAIRDAIAASPCPVVEVHISNVHAREEFRHKSLTAAVSLGQVVGFGTDGYEWAVRGLHRYLSGS